MVRSTFAKASADKDTQSTRRSFSAGGQAHHEDNKSGLILSPSKDEAGSDARLSRLVHTLRKRSFSIAGHRTSVALEPEFWTVLEEEARRTGRTLSALVAQVDASRETRPLASALRLAALAASGRVTVG